jgi:hypothetical protein
VSVGTGAVYGVESDGDYVYAVLSGTDGVAQVNLFNATTGAAPENSGYPASLSSGTVYDTALANGVLYVTHGDDLTQVTTSTGAAVSPALALAGRNVEDIWPYSSSLLYLADTEAGDVVAYSPTLLEVAGITATAASSLGAIGFDPGGAWVALGGPDEAWIYDFDGTLSVDHGTTIDGAGKIKEFATIPGYAFGATSDGNVLVLTDKPWVEIDEDALASFTDKDSVSISFTSDMAGTYTLERIDADSVKSLATGDVEAGVATTAEFEADGDDWIEGDNKVVVTVAAGTSAVGSDAAIVHYNTRPHAVDPTVTGGDGRLVVKFDEKDDDIDFYDIYISTTPFTADDFATGGPGYEGPDDVTSPIEVDAPDGDSVKKTLSDLTNGQTYYVAVRSTDLDGLESPMSDVQTAMAEYTTRYTERAGIEPGFCGFSGRLPGLLGVALAGVALARRRAKAAAIVAGALVVAAPAQAREKVDRTQNVQVRYGRFTLTDDSLGDAFTDAGSNILWAEYGWSSRFLEANLGSGFYSVDGYQIGQMTGDKSADSETLTLVPVALTATLRLDILDEQFLVPFARIGADYWIWSDKAYVASGSDEDETELGGRFGWHWAAGGAIRLDDLDRAGASKAEQYWGIDDSWLVVEYRSTSVEDFDSHDISLGLKLDY